MICTHDSAELQRYIEIIRRAAGVPVDRQIAELILEVIDGFEGQPRHMKMWNFANAVKRAALEAVADVIEEDQLHGQIAKKGL